MYKQGGDFVEFDMLHPEHGPVDTNRAFGTISFATLEPDFIFSCQFRDYINESVRALNGPIAVIDRDAKEMVIVIKALRFDFNDNGDIDILIEIDELSQQAKINVKYTMFLFSEYEYEVDIYQGEASKEETSVFDNVPYVSFIDTVDSPLGTIILKQVEENEMVFEEVRVFPSISISPNINVISSVIIADSHDSEFRIFVDFNREGTSEVAEKCKAAFSQDMSNNIAVLIVSMISSYLDGIIELGKEYKVFPACYKN
jgi:hypothetical protein